MNETSQVYEELLSRFVTWAESDDNIRAVIIMGSRVRKESPADEWSDLDLIVLVTDVDQFAENQEWADMVGTRIFTVNQRNPDGKIGQVKILYEGGYDIDFATASVESVLKMAEDNPIEFSLVGSRGTRHVLDKDNLRERLIKLEIELPKYQFPTSMEFLDVVSEFWYNVLWTAKHLRRGGLWWAKSGCDNYLKERLLRMLEWHTRAIRGADHDTWMRGRFLEVWADERAVHQLSGAYAHYDTEDVWRALRVTMDLFHWLAIETAEELGYEYPHKSEQHIVTLTEKLYSERNQSETKEEN